MLAKRAHKFSLIRSAYVDSPSHPVAIYQTLTGGDLPDASVEAKNRNLIHPSLGAVIARSCGARAPLLPPYVAIPHSGQLGNRVQHALRAYTPRDQKAVRTAATTFRANPKIDTEKAITELGKGEALVSMLDVKAVPAMVERVFIRPPSSQLGPVTPEQRKAVNVESPVAGKYDTAVDRESAYEKLGKRAEERASVAAEAKAAKEEARAERAAPRERESATDRFVKNVASSVGRQLGTTVARSIGNALIRGILGGLTRR